MGTFGASIFIVMFIVLFLAIFFGIGYIFKSIGIYTLAKRRGLSNSVLAFIPMTQEYVLGQIFDNINEYRQSYSNYRTILLILSIITTIFTSSSSLLMSGDINWFLVLIIPTVWVTFRVFKLIVLFNIYKEYAPDCAIAYFILSVVLYIDFIFLFIIRKNVPVSMCFTPQEEWQFEQNNAQLQQLWEEYHSSPITCSWEQFLSLNFKGAI